MPVILVHRNGRFIPVDTANMQPAMSRPADTTAFRNALAMGPIRGPRGELFAPSPDVMAGGATPAAAAMPTAFRQYDPESWRGTVDGVADRYRALDGNPAMRNPPPIGGQPSPLDAFSAAAAPGATNGVMGMLPPDNAQTRALRAALPAQTGDWLQGVTSIAGSGGDDATNAVLGFVGLYV